MASQTPQNSVWSAMLYTPPRGGCNQKTSILSSCPCLRFMLHPVKAATSFDCDGCGHHASFHSLENVAEDAILAKWSEQQIISKQAGGSADKKRKLVTEKASEDLEILELGGDEAGWADKASATRKRSGKQTRSRVPAASAYRVAK